MLTLLKILIIKFVFVVWTICIILLKVCLYLVLFYHLSNLYNAGILNTLFIYQEKVYNENYDVQIFKLLNAAAKGNVDEMKM